MDGIDPNAVLTHIVTIGAQVIALISAVLVAAIAARSNGSGAIKRIQQLEDAYDSFGDKDEWAGERANLKVVISDSVDRLYRSSQARRYFIWSLILLCESIAIVVVALSPLTTDMTSLIADLIISVITLISGCIVGGIGLHVWLKKCDSQAPAPLEGKLSDEVE